MSKIKLDFNYECKNSVVSFNNMDNGTNIITVSIESFGENVNLDNSIAVVAILKPSGKVHSQFADIKGNQVILNLEEPSTNEVGIYTAKLLLISGDKRKMTRSFKYEVEQENILSQILNDVVESSEYPLLTDMLSRLSTIENDEEQRKLNEAQRILNEDARVEAESLRVEAELTREHNDADREKAEAVRGTNENNRVKAEKLRSANEDARVGSENSRVEAENLRVEAENLRNDNYNFMTEDEARRRSNEDARVKAETERVKVEANRVAEESKRRTVETARVKAEDSRVKAETSRAGAEVKRVEAETSRVEAEKVRSSRYEVLIGEAEKSVQNFNSYASSAKLEEAERSNNENSRLEAEKLRSSNEATRINGEKVRVKNEQLRVEKEATRNNVFDAKVVEVNSKINEVNTAKNTMVDDTKKAINKMTNDFNSLSASQQQDAEVILARDGEESLNARFKRDLFIGDKSLKQEVIDLGGLKEDQDMAYVAGKGCLICKESKNGTVKDLKISGKSLKNVCAKRDFTIEGDGAGLTQDKGVLTEPIPNGIEYTVIVKVPSDLPNKNCFLSGYDKNGSGKVNIFDGNELYNNRGNVLIKKATNALLYDTPLVDVRLFTNATTGIFKLNDVMVIIGDHTQNPPNTYFEGIASVGNGVDEIEVSSMNNGNILNSELVKGVVNSSGDLTIPSGATYRITQKEIIKVVPGLKLYYRSIGERTFRGGGNTIVYRYGKNGEYLSKDNLVTFESLDIPNGCYGVRLVFSDVELDGAISIDKYSVVFSQFESFVDTPVKQDKKAILFKDIDGSWKPIKELRGLDTVCDTIELHNDGKYYHHIRTEKLLLDGINEDSRLFEPADISNNGENTISFVMTPKLKAFQMGEVISNRFVNLGKHWMYKNTEEGMTLGHGRSAIFIRLFKNKLSTLDKQGFMTYLQANNLTVIYQLVEEKVFEVNPLFLEAFEGETMMLISSGVINAPLEFKIASYITNLVLLNQQRISMLEEQVMGMFKSVLNGDMRTLAETLYPQDFVLNDDEIMLLNKL